MKFEKNVVFEISDDEIRKRICSKCPVYKKLEEIKKILEFPVRKVKKELSKVGKETLKVVKRIDRKGKVINWATFLIESGINPEKVSKSVKFSVQKRLKDLENKGYLVKARSYRTKIGGERVMVTDYRLV